MTVKSPEPFANIRRFDVFAEWSRLTGQEKHNLSARDARAYGIAVAKIVAARKFTGYQSHSDHETREWKRRARQQDPSESWWEHLGTNEEFERKIVRRMGEPFYHQVFQPAVRRAWDEGRTYEQIRDTLRADWNAALETQQAPEPVQA